MTILIAIILGIVQGLTEFLPVSSSGHLVLLQQIFNIDNNIILFDVILHLGTLIAVLFVFKKQVLELIKNPFGKKSKMLFLATIITMLIAFVLKDFFEESFNGSLLAFGFLITATILLITQFVATKHKDNKQLKYKNSAVAGLFQGLAILPGISRSGSTISSLVVSGIKKEEAAEFSFLMSIPIILASLFYEILKINTQSLSLPIIPIIAGFVFAIIFGVIAIKLMLKIIKNIKYFYFSIYLVIIAVFVLLNNFVFMWF